MLAVSYNSFNDITDLQLNGVAGTAETKDRFGNDIPALRFNNDRSEAPTAGGSIFTKNKIRLGEDLSFSTAFTYRNPHPETALGTGGITFTLQTVSDVVYGSGLQDESINPAISVAFVTDYFLGGGSGQGTGTQYLYNDAVTVYFNGDYDARIPARIVTDGKTIDPAPFYNVWIEYDGPNRKMEIRFSTESARPAECNYEIEGLDLAGILTSAVDGLDIEDVREVYAGFMGSWGDAKDKSEIISWYLKNDAVPIDFEPYDNIDAYRVTI